MPNIAILIGALLTLLGLITYLLALAGITGGRASLTALIPCVAGVLLMLLGFVGQRPAARKHAMHAAAVVGLLGFIAPAGRLIPAAASNNLSFSPAVVSQVLMSVLCALFVVLCVRSFIAARRSPQA